MFYSHGMTHHKLFDFLRTTDYIRFPFYYWIKILIVLWMISPAGSTMLYRRFVQPLLREREQVDSICVFDDR